MPKSKKELGAEYLKRVLAAVPEADRAAVAEKLKGDAIEEAAGSDIFSMLTDQEKIVAYGANVQNWYKENVEKLEAGTSALEELEKIKANPPKKGDDTPPPPAFDSSKFLDRAEAAKLLNGAISASAAEIAAYNAYLSNLAITHLHTFNEPLDVLALDQQARKEGKRVDQLYAEQTKEKREARVAALAKKEREDLEKEIRGKVEEEYRKRPQSPYPIGGDMGDPLGNATLGALKEKEPQYGKEAALDEFYKMRQTH